MSNSYRWLPHVLMRLRQAAGLALTLDGKTLQSLRIDDQDRTVRLMPKPMRPGWYMLEIIPSPLTLGSNLTLVHKTKAQSLALMYPGANKRIVYIPSNDTLRLRLDSPWDRINGSSLTLRRISSGFAQSRQIRKISNNSTCAAPGFRAHEAVINAVITNQTNAKSRVGASAQDLISSVNVTNCYNAFIERRTQHCSYRSWLDGQTQNRYTPSLQTDLIAPSSELFTTVQLRSGGSPPPQSSGQPVLLFDQEVHWQPIAAKVIEKALRSDPELHLFYFDHDHYDAQGTPAAPIFKPPWNPTLLLSGNYVGAVIALRHEAYNRVATELIRDGNKLQQTTVFQWLLALRLSLTVKQAHRVPFILYRQKFDTQLEGINGQEKMIGVHRKSSDQLVLSNHLKTIDTAAKVIAHDTLPAFDIQYAPLKNAPSVDIIIPTRDRIDLLEQCLKSLLALTRYPNFCITVVDNNSEMNASLNFFEHIVYKYPNQVKVLSWPHPFNYSAINNYAVAQSDKDIIVLLNNDTEVQHGNWLENMINELEQPGAGCVGAKLLYPSGQIQHAGVMTSQSAIAGHAHRFFNDTDSGYLGRLQLTHNVAAVTAACLAIRRSLFMSVDGLDQEHLTVAFNDVDLCLKVRTLGLNVVWTPKATLIHHESVSRGLDQSAQKAQRFASEISTMRERWGNYLDEDCVWHPIFELSDDDWDIAPWCQLY